MPIQDSIAGLTLDQAEDIDPFAGAADLMPGEGFAEAAASATTQEHAATKRPGPTLATSSPCPNIIAGADALDAFLHRQHHGDAREWWPLGPDGFAPYRFGPGSLYVVAAAPGRYKTALLLNWVTNILRAEPDLRAVIANAESPPDDLIARMAANLTGVPYGAMLDGVQGDERHLARLGEASDTLADVMGRVTFIDDASPTLDAIAAAAEATDARLILIDYLQCLAPPEGTRDGEAIKEIMRGVVTLAKQGRGILLASAATRDAARSAGTMQAGYGGAFVEHSATDFLTLDVPAEKIDHPDAEPSMLRHHKARNGTFGPKPKHSTRISCNGKLQRVTAHQSRAGGAR